MAVKFARIVFTDKNWDVIPIKEIKYIKNLPCGTKKVYDFLPKDENDFIKSKFLYGVEISCEKVPGIPCDRSDHGHHHYRPISIVDLGGRNLSFFIFKHNFDKLFDFEHFFILKIESVFFFFLKL